MRQDKEINDIWFTADTHFWHPKIVDICSRPISKDDHDKWLLDRINSKVKKTDTLYILGDVAMASKERTEKVLHKMNGNKILILGNHDDNIKTSTIFSEIKQMKDFNFNSESYPNIHIVLCHYPIASWNRKVHGGWHLHGHTHGRFQNAGLSFDVGVDAQNYYPISLEEVMDQITKKSLTLF